MCRSLPVLFNVYIYIYGNMKWNIYIWAAKSGTLVFTQQIAGIWLGCFSTILWYLVTEHNH
jgi:hypothetical protein